MPAWLILFSWLYNLPENVSVEDLVHLQTWITLKARFQEILIIKLQEEDGAFRHGVCISTSPGCRFTHGPDGQTLPVYMPQALPHTCHPEPSVAVEEHDDNPVCLIVNNFVAVGYRLCLQVHMTTSKLERLFYRVKILERGAANTFREGASKRYFRF